MPADYEIDVKRGVVFSSASGVLSDADLLDHVGRLRADPRFRSDFMQLQDYRAIEGLCVTAECIRRVASANPFGPGARRALVVSDDLTYGFARMYQGLTGRCGHEVEVFRNISEARRWLGLEWDRAI